MLAKIESLHIEIICVFSMINIKHTHTTTYNDGYYAHAAVRSLRFADIPFADRSQLAIDVSLDNNLV